MQVRLLGSSRTEQSSGPTEFRFLLSEDTADETVSWTIQRRYSHFAALDEFLRLQGVPGILLTLPPKTVLAQVPVLWKPVVWARERQLERWLAHLLRNEQVLALKQMQAFLRPSRLSLVLHVAVYDSSVRCIDDVTIGCPRHTSVRMILEHLCHKHKVPLRRVQLYHVVRSQISRVFHLDHCVSDIHPFASLRMQLDPAPRLAAMLSPDTSSLIQVVHLSRNGPVVSLDLHGHPFLHRVQPHHRFSQVIDSVRQRLDLDPLEWARITFCVVHSTIAYPHPDMIWTSIAAGHKAIFIGLAHDNQYSCMEGTEHDATPLSNVLNVPVVDVDPFVPGETLPYEFDFGLLSRYGQDLTITSDERNTMLKAEIVAPAIEAMLEGDDVQRNAQYLWRSGVADLRSLWDATRHADVQVRWRRFWLIAPFLSRLTRSPVGQSQIGVCFYDDLAGLHVLTALMVAVPDKVNMAIRNVFNQAHAQAVSVLVYSCLVPVIHRWHASPRRLRWMQILARTTFLVDPRFEVLRPQFIKELRRLRRCWRRLLRSPMTRQLVERTSDEPPAPSAQLRSGSHVDGEDELLLDAMPVVPFPLLRDLAAAVAYRFRTDISSDAVPLDVQVFLREQVHWCECCNSVYVGEPALIPLVWLPPPFDRYICAHVRPQCARLGVDHYAPREVRRLASQAHS